MIRKFIRMEYKFPSRITELTFEVDNHERAYLAQKINEVIDEFNLQSKCICNIEFLEFLE